MVDGDSGMPRSSAQNETRVWEREGLSSGWKNVHFHRSVIA